MSTKEISNDKQKKDVIKKEVKKRKRTKSNKLSLKPGTIVRLVREAYLRDPLKIMDISPELFHVLTEKNKASQDIRKSYFENYVTEREKEDFMHQVDSIFSRKTMNKENAIKALELLAAVGPEWIPDFKSKLILAGKALGIDFEDEKDLKHPIRRAKVAYRAEILRGVTFSFDWKGHLIEICLVGKEIQIRKSAESLVGRFELGKTGTVVGDGYLPDANVKEVVIDGSGLLSIVNRDASSHKKLSSLFLKLVNNHCILFCPFESLLGFISFISKRLAKSDVCAVLECLKTLVRVINTYPDGQEEILNLSLSNECFGLDMSSLYAVLLAVKSRLPILSADTAAIKAIQKLVPERLGEVRI